MIVNNTGGVVRTKGQKFFNGKMFSSSTPEIPAGEVGIYNVSNVDGGFMTGVAGEMDFKSAKYRYCVAFSHPYAGSFKCRVEPFKLSKNDWPKKWGSIVKKMKSFQTESKTTHSVHGGMDEKAKIPIIYITLKK